MAQASLGGRTDTPPLDRLFDLVPVAPGWVAVALALLLLASFAGLSAAFGGLFDFVAEGGSILDDRNARLGVTLALLAAYLPAARRYAWLGARRNFAALAPRLAERGTELEALEHRFTGASSGRRRLAGGLGLCLMPVALLLVDRDPLLYLHPGYWVVETLFTWSVGAFCCWNLGVFAHATLDTSRRFSELALRVPRIDLLEVEAFAPCARQGLLLALLWLIAASLFGVNLVDRGFLEFGALIGSIALVLASIALVLPSLGAHRRIVAMKQAELAAVNGAIRGQQAALERTSLGARAGVPGLADLLAYRHFVASIREWPFDAPMLRRLALYLLIPLLSWVGGAVVERGVDVLLD
jgi:hypothetical protein